MCDKFREYLNISGFILTKNWTENRFIVKVYCKEDDINVNKELNYLNMLFLNFNLMDLSYRPFEVEESISLRIDYFSTFVFILEISEKKNVFENKSN